MAQIITTLGFACWLNVSANDIVYSISYFPKKTRVQPFMQIVSNLHEMSNLSFWRKTTTEKYMYWNCPESVKD